MKRLNMLTAKAVAGPLSPGRHADGGNLYLFVDKSGARRWTFLYEFHRRQREIGLGSLTRVSLARAREKAIAHRAMLADGIDPLAAREHVAQIPTFAAAAAAYIASKRAGWRSAVHGQQWEKTIADYCGEIADKRVDHIGVEDCLRVLKPIWQRIPETASRLRGRIEMILDFAKAKKWRAGDNPAALKGNLAEILPARPKIAKEHHPAMPYREVPVYVHHLRDSHTVAARATEFLILTAARSGEVRRADWREIDLDAGIWSIPAEKMKAGAPHRVPLSPRAIEILREVGPTAVAGLIFPARSGRAMDAKALVAPAGYTIHGFRSSFRDFAGDETSFPREVAEAALSHAGPEGWARTDSKSGGWKPDSEEYIRSALERGERNALLTGAKERASESRGGSNKREPPWVALYLRRDAEIARENPWLGPYQIEQKIRKEDKIGGLPGRGALRKEALRLRARYRA